MKFLVDTCTFLWIASESPQLSKTAAAVFLDRNNEHYLSSASAWEIAIKHAAGRLPLPGRPDSYVPMIREASGIASLEIDEESALHAGRLPGLHSDPFDRMLVAQAVVHGMTILTPDPEIQQYAVRVLW
ncbi:MAG: type II toxin-antitoxin system VapC family toxin [Bryobacterales bacterium]|nr:type II toxin-antitoxin system VapC family toxin [Bryobacterales bacterium]